MTVDLLLISLVMAGIVAALWLGALFSAKHPLSRTQLSALATVTVILIILAAMSSILPWPITWIRIAYFVWASLMTLEVAVLAHRAYHKGWRSLRMWERSSFVTFSVLLPFVWALTIYAR